MTRPCGVAGLAALLLALVAGPALAEAAGTATRSGATLSGKQVFLLLFLMLGPVKILAPFVTLTRGADPALRRRLATRAILVSAAALGLAGLLGRNMLQTFSIQPPVLALTGGLVLFLVALKTVIEQFSAPPPQAAPPPVAPDPDALMRAAINPLAFPTIVTPYGIAATILFVEFAGDDMQAKLELSGIVALILLLDWLAMVFAHVILKWLGTALQVFAVVLGVTQIGLGLQVMIHSLGQILVTMLERISP